MFRVEKLNRTHHLEDFDCGVEVLNRLLMAHALNNQSANSTQSYVGMRNESVIGYFSLTVGEVRFEAAPERMKKGLARHPVPIMLLARLAVDVRAQGMGAGQGLLKDAIQRTLQAADIAGIRAMVVHAKDDRAFQFYKHFGFVDGFDNQLHLYMLIKDLRATTGA
jgi:GNAT superfamily N-acetyltransferase